MILRLHPSRQNNEGCRKPRATAQRARARRPWHPPRFSFTLIELLIVISIIALLAGAIVFTMMGAMEEARITRAQSQVQRINELIMRRWDEYRTRPLPIRVPPGAGGHQTALARLNALRAVMRYELPERISDVTTASGQTNPWGGGIGGNIGIPVPALALAYRRKVFVLTKGSPSSWSTTHQSSECLYLILSCMRSGDQVALDGFQASEIGDTDGDGVPEILDPWGNPIHFLRWAPQFPSPLQNWNTSSPAYAPDPFDPLKVGMAAGATTQNWAIYPLIYSAGPDGEYSTNPYGINESLPATYPTYASTSPWPNNPYFSGTTIGTPGPTAQDNIHNHIPEGP